MPQIGWSHLITILQKTKSHEELLWYINKTYEFGWSRTILLNKIKMKSFELKAIDFNNEIVLNDNKIDDIFNSTLVFDFIDRNKIKEWFPTLILYLLFQILILAFCYPRLSTFQYP